MADVKSSERRRMIALRCRCGNAVRRVRLEYEVHVKECITSSCPLCENAGEFEEIFYTTDAGAIIPSAEQYDWWETARA